MDTKSSALSKINWAQIVSFGCMLAVMFWPDLKDKLGPEFQAELVAGLLGLTTFVTIIIRTFFTTKLTNASAKRLPHPPAEPAPSPEPAPESSAFDQVGSWPQPPQR